MMVNDYDVPTRSNKAKSVGTYTLFLHYLYVNRFY